MLLHYRHLVRLSLIISHVLVSLYALVVFTTLGQTQQRRTGNLVGQVLVYKLTLASLLLLTAFYGYCLCLTVGPYLSYLMIDWDR